MPEGETLQHEIRARHCCRGGHLGPGNRPGLERLLALANSEPALIRRQRGADRFLFWTCDDEAHETAAADTCGSLHCDPNRKRPDC